MFPTIPSDVVEAVLKEHGGNLQSATEALLEASGEDLAQPGTSAGTFPAGQVWQDEELARAVQAQLDAETGRTGGVSWLHDDTRAAQGNDVASPASALWENGAEDPFKEWGKMAESVGQTLTEGFTMVTETLSSWLSGPFEDEEEPDARQRPAPARGAANGEERGDRGEVVTGGEGSSQAPLHRRAQLREPPPAKSHTPRAETVTDAWDEEDSKKDK
ncbi:g6472 [Coccomyxa elongata]